MVVAERKPLDEILTMLQPFKKILVAGCKGCVTVCNSGGKKEVEKKPQRKKSMYSLSKNV